MEEIKKKFKEKMKEKKFSNLVAFLVALLIVFILISFFYKGDKKEVKQGAGTLNVNASGEVENKSSDTKVKNEYEKEQMEQLKAILQKIDGVGNVDVYMTFESGEVKVPAYDNNTQTTVTEETDGDGGKRLNEQKNDGSKVVMATSDEGNEPFVTKVYKPKVVSVVVTAEGADKSKTKYNIEKAVADLYDLSFNKVNVYPMGEKHIN